MKIFQLPVLLCLFWLSFTAHAQSAAVDAQQFFKDSNMLNVTLTTDVSNLVTGKIKEGSQKAIFTCKLPDSSSVSEEISLSARGHMRRSICYIPPLRLNFHNSTSPKLYALNSLKLVCACRSNSNYQQLLFREYLIYKMYNLLTEKSFRVRLLSITYEDIKAKKKPDAQYAFLVENVDAMAKRNKCKELDDIKINSESADRKQMTLVAMFEYMIGNTDWSVPGNHNIKLITSKKDSIARPYAIPYDFDYSGLVNADYAVPEPKLGIENVLERLYRGYPRTMDELQEVFDIFNQQKESIYDLVRNFELLENSHKKEMLRYLDDFYKIISNPVNVKYTFIDNARQE